MKILNQLQIGDFDLHLHTTASDGIYSPTEVVQKAYDAGLSTIAITDHDTLAGLPEAQKATDHYNMHLIPGVELSTKWRKQAVDILGYNIQHVDQLHEQLAVFRDYRYKRAETIIRLLNQMNITISMEDVRQISGEASIARPHIAQAVVSKGYFATTQEVFDRLLADGKPASIEKKVLSVTEGIQMIRQAGGIAVLAHPVYIGHLNKVNELLQLGFDGIEVWHRNHQASDTKHFIRFAQKYQLILTGGSDFHHDQHQIGSFM
ncbi:PHP domain-containing protein [Hazenella sp. IB182353]|uniref:PHP domain-containing protein n=1 Tax=Polycladospora coralii TaxID=2771432 RepID=UPI0017465C03|nr:PHP domain-containing protein [Polycladospora coralii]MBS7529027.1 PHP domain-containing protein [Polycladospora coralii]